MLASMASRVWICLFLFVFSQIASSFASESDEAQSKEFVLTLDNSNFSDTVGKHDFVVVEFYAPWCGHCKKLAPEYEKAASALSSHDPPIILAKVDANEEKNKGLAGEFEIKGFPTLKILRNGGKNIQDYKGPRDAEGIVAYLKKQSGPASGEIKSVEDASALIDGSKIVVVGVFPEFSGEKYENFTAVAEKLRSEYEFGHTLDAKLLPHGESSVTGPVVRLFKPFDELLVDFKAMLFLNFSSGLVDAFKSKYRDVAEQYKGQGISFLLGDVEASQGAFQYFGLKDDQVPLIVIQTNDGLKYLKPNVEPEQISSWVKEYKEGNVLPYRKSEPIPEVNDESVKVVVADSLHDVVFNSGKNVLLEFYAPWCGHCKKLAPILDEVAGSFQSDGDVIIAKIDATANDIPVDMFDVKGYPTLYFRSASGNLLQYDGDRTKEDIIDFIKRNKDKTTQQDQQDLRKSEL